MITLVPIGEVERSALETLRQSLTEAFGQRAQVEDGIPLPEGSWNQRRGQHLASILLAALLSPPNSSDRVLGVVDVDIFAPGLNFVFGEADIAGRRALISLTRLRQEFYGFPKNENLFQERALKEAVHELGHTYGLKHCPNSACVMHFSNSLHDTDLKGWNFCPICQRKISKKV
jgi:archaemetzincin